MSNKANLNRNISASNLPEPAPANTLAENPKASDSLPFSEKIKKFTMANGPSQTMTTRSPIPTQKKFESASLRELSDQPLLINKQQESPSLLVKSLSYQKMEHPKTNTRKYSQPTSPTVQLEGATENKNEPKILTVKERMELLTGRTVLLHKDTAGSKEDSSTTFGALTKKNFESNELIASLNTNKSSQYQEKGQATEIMPSKPDKFSDTLQVNTDKKLLSANGEAYKPPGSADVSGRRSSFKNKTRSKHEVVGGDFSWMAATNPTNSPLPNERDRFPRRNTKDNTAIKLSTEKGLKDSET
jgi:hypothetical protein